MFKKANGVKYLGTEGVYNFVFATIMYVSICIAPYIRAKEASDIFSLLFWGRSSFSRGRLFKIIIVNPN